MFKYVKVKVFSKPRKGNEFEHILSQKNVNFIV